MHFYNLTCITVKGNSTLHWKTRLPLVFSRNMRKRVSKYDKSAVINAIGFLCVSLGSCTVQLQKSFAGRRAYACSEAYFSSQNGDHARGVYYRRTALCCAFLYGQKYSIQRKCFLFTVGSGCRIKWFITGCQKFRLWLRSWNGGAELAETTVQRLPSCGFRRTGKAMGQVYQW
jgi:hypothetical protein